MKILYENLIELLSIKPSKELLSSKLFQLGHEHNIDGDIFDFELTPNRGDCLSVNVLARDLNFFFGRSNQFKIYDKNIEELMINFENFSIEDCPIVSFLEIEIDKPSKEYSPYLESYFSGLSINKKNFFTDISNYLSYEIGQPTHCYDREKITDQIKFENRFCDESFITLLGDEVQLKGKNCVFTNNNKIINLAGIMGSKSTSCSIKTRKVLIEAAYFNPESIIGKTLKYNLSSDAAYKFERGVDPYMQEKALRRFLKIVEDHALIKSAKFISFPFKKIHLKTIDIDVDIINSILGTHIKKSDYINYLTKLGFNINDKINIPSHRHDIESQNDVAEEIARLIGYNNIQSVPISINNSPQKIQVNKIAKIKNYLQENGFTEVINYPFSETKNDNSIKVDNPLDSNKNSLRTDLKNSLIENLLFNERRQKDSIKLFEISDIYSRGKDINQEKKLGVIISGRRGNNYIDFSKKLDLEYLSNLFRNFDQITFQEIKRNELETKKKDKIFYFETLIDAIPESLFEGFEIRIQDHKFLKYKNISEFPSSYRDFSFTIEDVTKIDNLIECLDEIKDDLIKDSFIFDFYNGNKGIIKLGYRIIFQSYDKTLSEYEVNKKVKEYIYPLLEISGVSIQGIDI